MSGVRARLRKKEEKRVYEGNLYRPLTEGQIDEIHETSLRVFEEIGVCVKYAPARELWRKAGAIVDDETGLCRVGREVVEHCIAAAPKEFTQYGRESRFDIVQGGSRFYGGTAGEAVSVTDLYTGERRAPTIYDLAAGTRLCDALGNADIIQVCCYPEELDRENPDVTRAFIMAKNSSKPLSFGPYKPSSVAKLEKLCDMILGKEGACRERPFFTLVCGVVSPLIMDAGWTETLLEAVEHGFPVAAPSAPTLGSTCPGTLASQLMLCNVEALMTIITVQLKKPGHPCFYSAVPVGMDQRNGAFTFASAEGWMQNCAMNQIAHRHGIPSYTTCGHSDSKTLDAQLGMEAGMGVLLEAMSGANFAHGTFGLTEGGLNLSYENYVMADEYISMAKRILRGVEVNEDTLGFDALKERGAGAAFLDHPLTMRHVRTEFFYPKLSDRRPYATWAAAGSPSYAEAARALAKEIIESHKPAPLENEEAIRAAFPEIPENAGKIWPEL